LIPEVRAAFNDAVSPQRQRQVMDRMRERIGGEVPFRIAESPLFLPRPLLDEMDRASQEILTALQAHHEYRRVADAVIPREWLYPREDDHPLFVCFDYALANGGGRVVPRLTEFQGFPSLTAFQYYLSRDFRDVYALPETLAFLGEGLADEGFRELFRAAVLGSHAPENVVLLDVSPWQQGTWPDFRLTERLCPGIAVRCPSDLRRSGRELFYEKDGRAIRVKRIFNRVIWSDLARLEADLDWTFHEDLDFEWAGHPNWFFRYSKLALPWIDHPAVPKAQILDRDGRWPGDLRPYVLKPLFGFSGRGVVLDVTRDVLDAIPAGERKDYILQEKFAYADVIPGPGFAIRSEVRLMYVWLDRPRLVALLPRMSRGRLMGCDANRTEPWTGHGVAFWPAQ
jgi:hypothetical protein